MKEVCGNGFEADNKIAYIVGEGYELLTSLSRVLTIKQFQIAALEQRLPLHRIWIVGQGLSQNDLDFLRLCEAHLQGVRFHFCSKAIDTTKNQNSILERQSIHFIDATRVKAELNVTQLSEADFLAQDFLFAAARELTEHACQLAIKNSVLIIKQASFLSFHRLFPLPISVETKFQLIHDNKRSLKSTTRFYQSYACTAEVSLSFDLYEKEEADQFYKRLAEKTIGHFSAQVDDDN